MPNKPHTLGPRKWIVGMVYDSRGVPYTELECGHAVRWDPKVSNRPKRRSCSLCCEEHLPGHKLARCIEDVEAAKLEGKRQRLLAYYRSKGETPPEAALRRCSKTALYDSKEEIPRAAR